MYVPNVEIKEYTSVYREKVKDIVMNLAEFYPGIDVWLENELKKLDNGTDKCWMVTNHEDNVVGVAITGYERKGYDKLAKLKTFYLSEEIQRFAIGVHLMKKVLNYWMGRRIRSIFVTFAEEEFDQLHGFFDKFGFLLDGLSPHWYRPGKSEFIMSKTFVYGEIAEDKFTDVVKDYLLRMRGIFPDDGTEFVAFEDNKLTKTPRKVYVKILSEEGLDSKAVFEEMNKKVEETGSVYGLIFTYYPLQQESTSDKIKVIDGYMVENILYPLRLKKQGYSGIMLPIWEDYAKDLLDIQGPQRKIMRKRVSLTHEKAYFTGKGPFEGITRGSTFLFYLPGGVQSGGIIGEAKIKVVDTQRVDDAIKKYVNRGVITTENALRRHSCNGMVSIFLLTHVKCYPKKLPLNEMRKIVPGINCTGHMMSDEQIKVIRDSVMNDLNSY